MTQTMLDKELASLLAPLWESPDDLMQWGIVGDYCEENGLTKWCDCIRYLIREKRVVCHRENSNSPRAVRAWYKKSAFTHGLEQETSLKFGNESLLPDDVWAKLPYRRPTDTGCGRFYDSTESAYLALLEAWE